VSFAETFNTLLGYLGIGVFFGAIIFFVDGRIGLYLALIGMATGFLMNAVATILEFRRDQESRQWLSDVMDAALIGDFEKVKKLFSGDK